MGEITVKGNLSHELVTPADEAGTTLASSVIVFAEEEEEEEEEEEAIFAEELPDWLVAPLANSFKSRREGWNRSEE